MTSTISQVALGGVSAEAAAKNLVQTFADALPAHTLVRPYVTGEQPVVRPFATGEFPKYVRLPDVDTLVHPLGILPAEPESAEPVEHEARHAQPEERPDRYRGTRRAADPPWAWALVGAGMLILGEVLGLIVLAVTR